MLRKPSLDETRAVLMFTNSHTLRKIKFPAIFSSAKFCFEPKKMEIIRKPAM
jgi:hypothetical protein